MRISDEFRRVLFRLYKAKVADGSAQLTHTHHRQTPLWLMQGKAQAGVTWQSEVRFQEQAGHPIEGVAIPDAKNTTAIYGGAIVQGATHHAAAPRCLDLLHTPAGRELCGRSGLKHS